MTGVLETASYRIEGAATLLSSLSHIGESGGTVSYLRREKILTPDGVSDVPVVSGNALRGILRDHAAHTFWRALGSPELPAPVFHLLWSGGALTKTGGGKSLGARQLAQVRALVPVVSLFGGSGAGKIMEGKLSVGKLVPACEETAHLLPDGFADAALPSVWDLIQVEEFTRRDDSKREQLHPAIAGFTAAKELAPTQGELLTVDAPAKAVEDDLRDGPAQQMRYGVETLAAGTRLHWWMQLRHVTPVETGMLAAALDAWITDGAHIGGRSATGHGRLRLDVHQWQHQTPVTTAGTALAALSGGGTTDLFTAHVRDNQADILDALGWFA